MTAYNVRHGTNSQFMGKVTVHLRMGHTVIVIVPVVRIVEDPLRASRTDLAQ